MTGSNKRLLIASLWIIFLLLVSVFAAYGVSVMAQWSGTSDSSITMHKKTYAWALGGMFFFMLCISAWMGYQFALAQERSKSIRNLQNRIFTIPKGLHRFTENSADMLWTQNPDGVFTSCNPALSTYTDFPEHKIIGSNYSMLFRDTNTTILSQYHDAILLDVQHPAVEVRIKPLDHGKERIFEVIKSKILDEHGHLIGVQSVARDVTLRSKQELQLKDALGRLRMLQTCVDQLNDVILISEADPIDFPGPRIIYVNPAFERMTGYTLAEVVGKTPRILQGPRTQLSEIARIRKALKAWKSIRSELINYTKSGREFWVELNINPVADETGYFTHWVAVQREITDRKVNG